MEGFIFEQSGFLERARGVESDYTGFAGNGGVEEERSESEWTRKSRNGVNDTNRPTETIANREYVEEPDCREPRQIDIYNGICINVVNDRHDNEVFHSDIILLKGQHFEKVFDSDYEQNNESRKEQITNNEENIENGNENEVEGKVIEMDRDWIIITADRILENYLPMNIGERGIIAGRGQVAARNGEICIFSKIRPTMLTNWEINNRKIRLEEFIDLGHIKMTPILCKEAKAEYGSILEETYRMILK